MLEKLLVTTTKTGLDTLKTAFKKVAHKAVKQQANL